MRSIALRRLRARPALRKLLARHARRTASLLPPSPFTQDEAPLPELRTSQQPLVSIVITHWGDAAQTLRCLASIGQAGDSVDHEIIVVDDATPDPRVRSQLSQVDGIRFIALDENVGYLRATNVGVSLARGSYLVLLNNDVQVLPGWLDALVRRVESDASVDAVGARLVHPNGRLQEAGGIIWQDGDGWNYGRGDDPTASAYRFCREVDYVSAACMLVRRRSPVFDERFAPAYYEDTDLCFDIRDHGGRVLYEPAAVVYHMEGASHGTDTGEGLKAYQPLNRDRFVQKWAKVLAHQLPAEATNVERASDRRRGHHIVVVDDQLPRPDRDSGSVRMHAILRLLTAAEHRVHFIPADHRYRQPYGRDLEVMGVEVIESEDAERRLAQRAGDLIELCVLSRPLVAAEFGRRVRRLFPHAVVVYDMVDFHSLREQRSRRLGLSPRSARMVRRALRAERQALCTADAVIAISEDERREVLRLVPEARVWVVPNIHDRHDAPAGPTPTRNRVVFVGGFLHAPNVDAVQHILDDLSGLIADQLPGVTVDIVGADPPSSLVDRAPSNVRFLGWVDDLASVYECARVAIAPLRVGAGVKGKIGEAMSYGVPVVTTSIGAEGFGASAGTDLLVEDDPNSFVSAVHSLFVDDDRWLEIARAGYGLIEREFSATRAEQRLRSLLEELLGPTPAPARLHSSERRRDHK